MAGVAATGLAFDIVASMRNDAIPEGHIEVSSLAEARLICPAAPYTANVSPGIVRGSFKFTFSAL